MGKAFECEEGPGSKTKRLIRNSSAKMDKLYKASLFDPPAKDVERFCQEHQEGHGLRSEQLLLFGRQRLRPPKDYRWAADAVDARHGIHRRLFRARRPRQQVQKPSHVVQKDDCRGWRCARLLERAHTVRVCGDVAEHRNRSVSLRTRSGRASQRHSG